ncbi:MAG: sialidase family protein, partial [Bacteroidota bacterium]
MKKQILFLAIILWSTNASAQMYNEITRGHVPGEIYMSSIWYEPSYMEERYDAVFYSSDNGETIGIRYAVEAYSSEMPIGNLISDATPGVIYDFYLHSFWISYDYGYSWSSLTSPGNWTDTFTSGSEEGVIYLLWSIDNRTFLRLHKSTDYGENFQLVNDNPGGGRAEVGTEANELYLIRTPSPTRTLRILFSNNGGIDFNLQCELDSTIGGYVIWGQHPVISRGISPGELYLVTWHHPANYHIYHSTDYGQTFEQRFVSDSCNLLEARYCFTAGVEPGSFYVKYSIPWVDGVNTEMHILY